jgi:hypothetical protein
MGHGELKNYLKHNLFEYEFVFRTNKECVTRDAEAATVEVGSAFLPAPPTEDGVDVAAGWNADVHAHGSSRPWATHDSTWGTRPRMKKRRSMGKVTRARAPVDEKWIPIWAMDDALIPCEFNPSCKFN